MNYKIINGAVSYGAETILDEILKVYTPLKLLEKRI